MTSARCHLQNAMACTPKCLLTYRWQPMNITLWLELGFLVFKGLDFSPIPHFPKFACFDSAPAMWLEGQQHL